MSDLLQYKGYHGTVEFSAADGVLYGKVIGINGLISYEGDSIAALKEDFESSIDDYLEMCAEKGIDPEKSYKGTFNVRIAPELHKQLTLYSASLGKTLNSAVEEAIFEYVTKKQR